MDFELYGLHLATPFHFCRDFVNKHSVNHNNSAQMAQNQFDCSGFQIGFQYNDTFGKACK